MKYNRLGNHGIKLSALSLGSWLTFGKQITDDVAEKLMRRAYEAGINFFDNAEGYAGGDSERVMGHILKKTGWDRTTYIVSSKVFFGGELPNQYGLSRKHIFDACDGALKRLQVDYLDLYFCHRPDPETPISETVWAMNHLIAQGKVMYWGTSEWSAEEIMEAHQFAEKYRLIGPAMEQPQYNLLHRKRFEEEYAPLYKEYGMGTTIWSPLASGILSGKYNAGDFSDKTRMDMVSWLKDKNLSEEMLAPARQFADIAQEAGIRPAQLALAWCLKNENVSTVILGASKLEQLEENLKALEVVDQLDESLMKKLSTLGIS